jgi:hypothetical protein
VILEKRDRRWFGAATAAGWLLGFGVMTVGGFVAWVGLGTGLCEDDGSSGSDTYCSHGGWEATGLAIAALAVLAVLVPAGRSCCGEATVVLDRLLSPLALGLLVVAVSASLGTD